MLSCKFLYDVPNYPDISIAYIAGYLVRLGLVPSERRQTASLPRSKFCLKSVP